MSSPRYCGGGTAGPGRWHHQGRGRRRPVAQRLVDGDVPGVEHAELGAAEHEQAVLRTVAELLTERRH